MAGFELQCCGYCGGAGECVAVPLNDDGAKALLLVECPECRGLCQVLLPSRSVKP